MMNSDVFKGKSEEDKKKIMKAMGLSTYEQQKEKFDKSTMSDPFSEQNQNEDYNDPRFNDEIFDGKTQEDKERIMDKMC